MIKHLIVLLTFSTFSCLLSAQTYDYLVGSSAVSIDPDSSVVSLALAGYGAPGAGRFSIKWEPVDKSEAQLKMLSGCKDNLYAMNDHDELVTRHVTSSALGWKKIGMATNMISLCGDQHKLFGITSNGKLQSLNLEKPGSKWTTIDSTKPFTALTTFDGKLFASDGNALWSKRIDGNDNWLQVSGAPAAISLTSHSQGIFILTADNDLFLLKNGNSAGKWVKIARLNDATVVDKLTSIAFANNRMYAINSDSKLFVSGHSTDKTLSARALAIRQGNKTVVIVGFDACGFDSSLTSAVRSELSKRRHLPGEAIFLNASHTHFAPVTQTFPCFGEHGQVPDSQYLNNTVKRGIIKAAELALDHMTPSTIRFGRGYTTIGHNRSSPDNRTPYDSAVDVIYTASQKNTNENILFLAACHPVFKNEGKEGYTVSANYPGTTRTILEEAKSGRNTIFLQGCAGDINPADDDHVATGTVLAKDVSKILDNHLEDLHGGISYSLDTIRIAVNAWSEENILKFRNENSGKIGNVGAEKNVRWANMMLDYYKKGTLPAVMPIYCQTINIGKWKLVGLSREVVTAYSFAIKNLWPDKWVTVAGYTNAVPSYLPAESHINAKTYEGYDSFFWNAQPALFPSDVLSTVVKRIAAKNR